MLIIVAFVILFVVPHPWNVVGFVVALVLAVPEFWAWNRTVKHQRRVVGAHTLIGREAVVVTPCAPDGQVRVDGEIWAAHCEAGAAVGDAVRIAARHRLVLTVERSSVPGEGPSPVAS
jgi:membrane protein implicated in regulation of membrane protease activity